MQHSVVVVVVVVVIRQRVFERVIRIETLKAFLWPMSSIYYCLRGGYVSLVCRRKRVIL